MTHATAVWALVFSPDGHTLYTGGMDGALHAWDALTGEHYRALAGHERSVLDIRFTRDGKHLVTSSRDGAVAFWQQHSGEPASVVRPGGGGVFAALDTERGLFCACHDGTIRAPPHARAMRGHTAATTDLARVGDRLVSAARDCTVRVWSLEGDALAVLAGHEQWVTRVRAGGGATFVTASEDGCMASWNLDTGRPRWMRSVNSHRVPVWGLDVSRDGRHAITGDATGIARLWDLVNDREPRELERAALAHRACAFSPDGERVALASDDGSIGVYLTGSGALCWRRDGTALGILSAVVDDSAQLVVTGHADGSIRSRRIDGAPAPRFAGHERFVYQMRRVRSGVFASAAFDGGFALWEIETGQALRRCDHGGQIFSFATWREGRCAATCGEGVWREWELESGALIRTERLSGSGAHTFIAAGAEGTPLVTAAEDGVIELWEGSRRTRVIETGVAPDMPSALAVSSSGRIAAVGLAGGEVLVIDLAGRRVCARHPCHEDWIRDLRITADERYVVASCQDAAVVVLSLADGAPLPTGLPRGICAIAFDGAGALVGVDTLGGLHEAALPA